MKKKPATTHTPGPWTVEMGGVSGPDGKLVASNVHYAQSDQPPFARWYFDNGEANAALISAAPDLLGALKEIVRMTGRFGGMQGAIRDIAQAAILKASPERSEKAEGRKS